MDKVLMVFVYIAAGLILLTAIPFVPGDPIETFKRVVPWVTVLFVLAQLLNWENLKNIWLGIWKWIFVGVGAVGIVAALYLTPFGEFSWFYDTMTLVCVVLAAVALVVFYGRGVWLKRFLVISITCGVLTMIGNTLMHELHRETTNLVFSFTSRSNGYPQINCDRRSSILIPENKILRIKVQGYYKYTDDQGVEHSYNAAGDVSEWLNLSQTTGGQCSFDAPVGQQLLRLGETFLPPEMYDMAVKGDRYEVEIPAADNPGGWFFIRPNETRQVMYDLKGKIRVRIVVLERDEMPLVDYAKQQSSDYWRRSNQKRGDKARVKKGAGNIYQDDRTMLTAKCDKVEAQLNDLPSVRLSVEADLIAQAIAKGEDPAKTITAADVEEAYLTKRDGLMRELKELTGQLEAIDQEREINSQVNVIPPVRNRSASSATARSPKVNVPVVPASASAPSVLPQLPQPAKTKTTKTSYTVEEAISLFPAAGSFSPSEKSVPFLIRNENCDLRHPLIIIFKAIEGMWVELTRVPYGQEAAATGTDGNGVEGNTLVNEQYLFLMVADGKVIPPVAGSSYSTGQPYVVIDTQAIRENTGKSLSWQGPGDDVVMKIVCHRS